MNVPVAPGPAPIPARQVTREDIMRLTVAQLRAEIAKYVVLSNLLYWFCVQRTCAAVVVHALVWSFPSHQVVAGWLQVH